MIHIIYKFKYNQLIHLESLSHLNQSIYLSFQCYGNFAPVLMKEPDH